MNPSHSQNKRMKLNVIEDCDQTTEGNQYGELDDQMISLDHINIATKDISKLNETQDFYSVKSIQKIIHKLSSKDDLNNDNDFEDEISSRIIATEIFSPLLK